MSEATLSPEVQALLLAQQQMFAKLMSEMTKQSDERLERIVAELKKPSVMEQKKLDAEAKELEQRQQERRDNSEAFKMKRAQDKWVREHCTHQHADGKTHCVWIAEKNNPNGYILCQANHCKIRPEPRPEKFADEDAVYDTNLFNRLFQSLPTQEIFG